MKKWTYEERQTAWDLFARGYMYRTIAERINRDVNTIRCQCWKMSTNYDDKDARSRVICLMDRELFDWTPRDLKILKLAKKAGVPNSRIAEMLGKTIIQVAEKLEKKRKGPTIFDILKRNE